MNFNLRCTSQALFRIIQLSFIEDHVSPTYFQTGFYGPPFPPLWEGLKQGGTTTQCGITILFVSLEVTAKYHQRKRTTLAQKNRHNSQNIVSHGGQDPASNILWFFHSVIFKLKVKTTLKINRQIMLKQASNTIFNNEMCEQLGTAEYRNTQVRLLRSLQMLDWRKHQTFRSG